MSYYLFLSKKFICFKRLMYDFFLLRLVYEIKEGGQKNSLCPSKCFPLPGTFHIKMPWNSGRRLDMVCGVPHFPTSLTSWNMKTFISH